MTNDVQPPSGRPEAFRATVHGTAFAGRDRLLDGLAEGSRLTLIPEYGNDPGAVWVHLESGDPVGHLPEEIGRWLAPWMARGGRVRARALRVHGPQSPSWKRLVIGVALGAGGKVPSL